MIFACESCHYVFEAPAQPEQCPDCGKAAVRAATEGEKQGFYENMMEGNNRKMDRLPDFVQLNVVRPDYLKFNLPVSAFGIQDDMIMEVSVEYMLSEDQKIYKANVWCRERGSKSKRFLYAPAISVGENVAERIIEHLNEDPVFESVMLDYIDEAVKHRRED